MDSKLQASKSIAETHDLICEWFPNCYVDVACSVRSKFVPDGEDGKPSLKGDTLVKYNSFISSLDEDNRSFEILVSEESLYELLTQVEKHLA